MFVFVRWWKVRKYHGEDLDRQKEVGTQGVFPRGHITSNFFCDSYFHSVHRNWIFPCLDILTFIIVCSSVYGHVTQNMSLEKVGQIICMLIWNWKSFFIYGQMHFLHWDIQHMFWIRTDCITDLQKLTK